MSVASDVLGTFGAVFWSIQLLPQIYINWRRPSHTTGLQPSMMLLWSLAAVPLGIYNILSRKSIALQIQPQILAALSLVTWGQVYFYGHKWSLLKTCTAVFVLGALCAGLEVLGTLPFMLTRSDGSAPHAYLEAMAILSAIGLGLGVLRHYWDIYTHRSVRGISFIFVFLDAMGDLTSLLSVVVVQPVDVLGAVIYAVELILWIGIMLCGLAFNFRSWVKRDSTPDSTELQDVAPSARSQQGGEEQADAASLSSSVFHTVGLQHKALRLLRLRRRPAAAA